MKQLYLSLALMTIISLTLVACDSGVMAPNDNATLGESEKLTQNMAGPVATEYSGFGGMVFDIAAGPNGNLLVPVTNYDLSGNILKEITRRGVKDVTSLPLTGSGFNGVEPVGQRNFFATSGGLDLTAEAGLWRVSQGNARLVADISDFVMGDWNPDDSFEDNDLSDAGPYPERWKDFRCETFAQFSHGPQTNPFHLTKLNGSEVLIGDAANNAVLWADTNGDIEVVAFMDPAYVPNTKDWMELGTVDNDGNIVWDGTGEITCYVEPVPTSVAVGPDGAYYVGELTGTTPHNFAEEATPEGMARVWRIEPGSRNVVCPSSDCTLAFNGLNAIMDLEFGPDGKLYVLEFDQNGYWVIVDENTSPFPAGGALKECDLGNDSCKTVKNDLTLPSAITFDKWNQLWVVDNALDPTVRPVDLQ